MNSCNDFTPKFIEVPPLKPLQVEFVPLVDDARFSLRTELGTLLDSLYLYGSVSRASAQLGRACGQKLGLSEEIVHVHIRRQDSSS